jgi:hypothetical protein
MTELILPEGLGASLVVEGTSLPSAILRHTDALKLVLCSSRGPREPGSKVGNYTTLDTSAGTWEERLAATATYWSPIAPDLAITDSTSVQSQLVGTSGVGGVAGPVDNPWVLDYPTGSVEERYTKEMGLVIGIRLHELTAFPDLKAQLLCEGVAKQRITRAIHLQHLCEEFDDPAGCDLPTEFISSKRTELASIAETIPTHLVLFVDRCSGCIGYDSAFHMACDSASTS